MKGTLEKRVGPPVATPAPTSRVSGTPDRGESAERAEGLKWEVGTTPPTRLLGRLIWAAPPFSRGVRGDKSMGSCATADTPEAQVEDGECWCGYDSLRVDDEECTPEQASHLFIPAY